MCACTYSAPMPFVIGIHSSLMTVNLLLLMHAVINSKLLIVLLHDDWKLACWSIKSLFYYPLSV